MLVEIDYEKPRYQTESTSVFAIPPMGQNSGKTLPGSMTHTVFAVHRSAPLLLMLALRHRRDTSSETMFESQLIFNGNAMFANS